MDWLTVTTVGGKLLEYSGCGESQATEYSRPYEDIVDICWSESYSISEMESFICCGKPLAPARTRLLSDQAEEAACPTSRPAESQPKGRTAGRMSRGTARD